MTENVITVGLGALAVSKDPQQVIVAYGLGSCLGIGMFDPATGVAGLLHAMLPEFTKPEEETSPKYVNSGIETLVMQMEQHGANRSRLRINVVGGANMLIAPGFKDNFNIGERNIVAAQKTFDTLNLKVKSQEVGGHIGRTFKLYVGDGRMTIRTMGNQEREI